jgi:long-chain acyl-CoA synthetase
MADCGTSPARQLAERIRAIVDVAGGERALLFDGSWFTWSEFADLADCAPDAAPSLAVVVTRNDPLCARVVVSSLAVGGSLVCLDALESASAIVEMASRGRYEEIFATDEDWRRLREVGFHGSRASRVRDLAAMRPDSDVSDPVAVEIGTSGTTGAPKRFSMRYSQLFESLTSTRRHIYGSEHFGRIERNLRPAIIHTPISHIGGFYRLVDNVVTRRPILLMAKFEPRAWSELVHEHQVRVDGLNATTLRMVLDAGIGRDRLTSLRAVRCGMAPVSEQLRAEFEGTYGVPILRAYGATEFSGEIAGWTLEDYKMLARDKVGSVGRLYANVEARVVDDAGSELTRPKEVGVLQLRGRRFGDGRSWLATNDLASIDGDRFLWIHGRLDDAISRGGFKIVPEEVGKALCSHPSVKDAFVAGVADDRLGSVVGAVVTLRPGASLAALDLRRWCESHLPRYMLPARLVVADELPRLRSLKVDRRAVKRLLEESPAIDRSR